MGTAETDLGPEPTLEWFGCTTFRLRVGPLTLWLDTFLDRVPSAPQVGLTAAEVTEADHVFISHCHFDHILGADVIARNTGAQVVGSHEAMRLMAGADVPEAQRWPVSGGETIDCGHGVTVEVYPSIHSCLFAAVDRDSGACCVGDLGLFQHERRARQEGLFALTRDASVVGPEIHHYLTHPIGPFSDLDGGQLIYLVRTPHGSLLFSASAGGWSAILRTLRPDVALLAAAGRPNLDGEPFQGTMAEFLVRQVEALRPRTVALCHHDAFLPPLMEAHDTTAAVAALTARTPWARLLDLRYGAPVAIFA